MGTLILPLSAAIREEDISGVRLVSSKGGHISVAVDFVESVSGLPEINRFLDQLCEVFNITTWELLSPNQTRRIVRPRMVAMYFLYNSFHQTQTWIRDLFGKKDHTTVIHALKAIPDQIESDLTLREKFRLIEDYVRVELKKAA